MLLDRPAAARGAPPRHLYTVLVLCTGNSARSILAEALFNRVGGRWFRAFSAGSHPVGRVHPFALELVERLGVDRSEVRSKSWLEFSGSDAPPLDFVITVCDAAAGESCPSFSGAYRRVHWDLPDPASATGSDNEVRRAFADCFNTLGARVRRLAQMPLDLLGRDEVGEKLRQLADEHSPPVERKAYGG